MVSIKDEDIVIETGADRNKMKIKKWAIGSNESRKPAAKTEEKDGAQKKGFFSFLKK